MSLKAQPFAVAEPNLSCEPDEVLASRWLKPFGHRIAHSELWRFTRRSVPRGVFAGLFVGIFLMVPGLQIVGAALLCVPMRGNIPISAAMTFLSNPLTTPFFLGAAMELLRPFPTSRGGLGGGQPGKQRETAGQG